MTAGSRQAGGLELPHLKKRGSLASRPRFYMNDSGSRAAMRCGVALAFASSLAAKDQRFEVRSRLVLVPVTVTDTKGHTIDGLDASDFRIRDNRRPRKVVVDTFGSGVAPIALVVAVQSSGISAPALAKVRRIGAMIRPLITGRRGCAALVAFDERVEWLQDCTSDPDEITRAFHQLQPGAEKSARMLDAMSAAIERLRRRPNVRRVLLLISESRDCGSETDLDAIVVAAQTAAVTVYAASYSAFKTAFTEKSSGRGSQPKGPPAPSKEPESPPGRERVPIPPPEQRLDVLGGFGELLRLGKTNATQVLTQRTGGTTFPFTRQRGLDDAIQKLGTELHTQYVLSFTPDPTPGFHRLEVRIERRGKFRVRARPGYWSRLPSR